jgi:hydroxylamine reductase
MFCNQCEQTKGNGCVDIGMCSKDQEIQSLQEILLYGVKGMAAYAHHARRLGKTDESVNAFIEEALFATVTNVNFDFDSHVELVLECGRQNLRTMQLLDEGHVEVFGKPSPHTVYEGTKAGPGILVTGHDMVDLRDLLEQTKGTGVNVYTHGEMLPAFMYPELRKYEHLAGHWGGAWQKQKSEFASFGGAILATTNCVMPPLDSYKDRMFSTRVTSVAGGHRLKANDFAPVIEAAKKAGSLKDHKIREMPVGFHHSFLLSVADKIVDAVKAKKLNHFFVIGGCDGAEAGRNYFTEYAAATPKDSVVLTVGCGKYRIRDVDFGTIDLPGVGPIPRLLDMGQCNDSYGAITVAVALAKAFNCGVNDLPLHIVLSWFEQKAVAVLLTLLALGVKGVRIGPRPPAFVSPKVFKLLQDAFDLQLIGTDAKADLATAIA